MGYDHARNAKGETIFKEGPRNATSQDILGGKLVPCDAKICPHAVDGINHAPFAAFGGWSGGINAKADPKVKDAAYAFLSYMAQPAQSMADVVVGKTGYNPYRISHFENTQAWIDAGFSPEAAEGYLSGIEASLNSPNMVADLRIPSNQKYIQVELDRILAEYIAVDPDAPYYSASMVGLTAVSYTLFFVLSVALRTGEIRLFLITPALYLAALLASLRILHLNLSGKWEFAWAVGIALVCIQLAVGLYYWPLSPIRFGLLLVGPLYGLVNLAINLGESVPTRRAVLEPAVVTALCCGLAIFLR